MPVPATIADLNTDEALNSPSDADTITPTTRPSDYLRAHAAIIKQLATDTGLSAGFIQTGTGAVTRTALSKMRDVVSVFDFMTTAQIADVQGDTLLVDVTAAIQAAIDAVQSAGGGTLLFPAGSYKITDTLNVTKAIWIVGEGLSKTILSLVVGIDKPAIKIYTTALLSNTIHGGGVRDIQIDCNAVGDGIMLDAVSPYPIHRMEFKNIWIIDCRDGIYVTSDTGNICYRNRFQNILATVVKRYGIYAIGSSYNVYEECEVSTTTATGYALYIAYDYGGAVLNFTTGSVAYIDVPAGRIDGYVCETMQQAAPPQTTVLRIIRALSVKNVDFININGTICPYGIEIGDTDISIDGVSLTYSDATPHIDYPLSITAGAGGYVSNWIGTGTFKLEAYTAAAEMEAFKFHNANDLTDTYNMGAKNVSALPAASEKFRGNIMVVKGGAGVADLAYVCRKNAADAYEWQQLA